MTTRLVAASPPPANAVTAPPDEQSFAVRDVRVFDGERVLEHTSVVVRASRIGEVLARCRNMRRWTPHPWHPHTRLEGWR